MIPRPPTFGWCQWPVLGSPSVPTAPARHRPRCRDSGRCFRASCARAGAGRLTDCQRACLPRRHVAYILSMLTPDGRGIVPWFRIVGLDGIASIVKVTAFGVSQQELLAQESVITAPDGKILDFGQAELCIADLAIDLPMQTRPSDTPGQKSRKRKRNQNSYDAGEPARSGCAPANCVGTRSSGFGRKRKKVSSSDLGQSALGALFPGPVLASPAAYRLTSV